MNTETKFTPDDIAETQALVKRRQKIHGLTNAVVARQVNMPPSTFSQVVNGNYTGTIDTYILKLKHWLREQAERDSMSSVLLDDIPWVETSVAKTICQLFQQCFTLGQMGLVVGKPGWGKTESGKEYARTRNRAYHIECSSAHSSATSVVRALLKTIGIGASTRNDQNRQALTDHLLGGVSLLIIDEAQHLSIKTIEELRSFHDATGCGLVLVGNDTVSARLGGSRAAEFAQITSRIGPRLTITHKHRDADVELLLDVYGVEHPDQRELLVRVARSPGALRRVKMVLSDARVCAPQGTGEDAFIQYLKAASMRVSGQGQVI